MFSSVQSLSRVLLFVTPWIAARQASLSITNSRSSLKLPSIESVIIYEIRKKKWYRWSYFKSRNKDTDVEREKKKTWKLREKADDGMNWSKPCLPVHHQLLEFTQTHVHWVSDAIQPSHPLLSPSLPAPNLSQHQGLFQCYVSFE